MRTYTLTNDDYYNAEIAIYNDLPTTLLYRVPENRSKPSTKNFTKHLLEGEKWEFLKGEDRDHIAITSYARVFNSKTSRQLQVRFTNIHVLSYFNQIRIQSANEFEARGWEHNLLEIYDRYVENDWSFRVARYINNIRESYLERV